MSSQGLSSAKLPALTRLEAMEQEVARRFRVLGADIETLSGALDMTADDLRRAVVGRARDLGMEDAIVFRNSEVPVYTRLDRLEAAVVSLFKLLQAYSEVVSGRLGVSVDEMRSQIVQQAQSRRLQCSMTAAAAAEMIPVQHISSNTFAPRITGDSSFQYAY